MIFHLNKITIIFFLILINIQVSFSQEVVIEHNENYIIKNRLIVKLSSQGSTKMYAGDDILLKNILLKYKIVSINKKFPSVTPPNQACNKCVDLTNIFEIDFLDNINIIKLTQYLESFDFIEYAEPSYVMQTLSVPNDPLLYNQYHLYQSKIIDAWDVYQGDSLIIIGITDTGFDLYHDDLIFQTSYNYNDIINGIDDDNDGYIDNFRGWDMVENNSNPHHNNSAHGTMVAGIAAATTNNNVGIAGVGNKIKFLPIKVSNDDGRITKGYEGILYAVEYGCKIVNCSWGTKGVFSKFGRDIVNYATYNKDALVVCAAGNSHDNIPWFPASYEATLSVGGTVEGDSKWSRDNSESNSGSSWGIYVDISAPAANYWSTTINNGYAKCYGGTSFACPIVSGAAALVRGYYPHLSALETTALLKSTSDYIYDIEYNFEYRDLLGTGRLNLYKALTDTSLPYIRFEDYSFVSSYTNSYKAADTIEIIGSFNNLLNHSEDINVYLESNSEYIDIIRSNFAIREIDNHQQISNESYPFMFTIKDNVPYDYNLLLKIVYSSENYRDYEYISFTINPSLFQFATHNLNVAVASNGLISCIQRLDGQEQTILFNNQPTFYDASLILAMSNSKVVSNILNSADFRQTSDIENIDNPSYSDIEISTFFDDSYATSNRLEVEVENKIYAWQNSNLLIYSYIINNVGNGDIENVYAGIFSDWNIMNSNYNKVFYNESKNMIYARNTRPDSYFVGIQFLGNKIVNKYTLDYNMNDSEQININEGLNNEQKFFALTNSNSISDNLIIGSELASVVSSGPFYIPAHDTLHFDIALLFANDVNKLNELSDEAVLKYNIINNIEFTTTNDYKRTNISVVNISTSSVKIFTTDEVDYSISIYDCLGRCVWSTEMYLKSGINQIPIQNIEHNKMYFINISNYNKSVVSKAVLK
jgi:serine protease